MIEIEQISIDTLDDYNKISNFIKEEYNNELFIKELQERVGLKCNCLLIEYPYYDADYLSTYYSFYSKLFKNMSKKCYRIHILTSSGYMGYITLRPTVSYTKVGKSYINPKVLLNKKAYIALNDFKANIAGNQEIIPAYPWMYQETDISVCAHVATWSVIRYYGNKYPDYSDKRMMNIVEYTPNGMSRNIPSKGLVLTQIADILRKNDFHPLIIGKEDGDKGEFIDEVYSYIESGIPLVAAITSHGHAVSMIGHGEINYDKLDNAKKEIIYSSELIDSFIINDDNFFPYIEVSKKENNMIKIQSYDLEDINYIVVPLYERMMLGYWTVRQRVESLIKSKILKFNDLNVVRIYLTSSRSLKQRACECNKMNEELKGKICRLTLPKFVWCIDISSPEEYKSELTSGRIIIDSTSGTYENQPWLLLHDKERLIYKKGTAFIEHNIDIEAYPIYKNNLKEV